MICFQLLVISNFMSYQSLVIIKLQSMIKYSIQFVNQAMIKPSKLSKLSYFNHQSAFALAAPLCKDSYQQVKANKVASKIKSQF